jgi:hypothetical protein
MRTGTPQLGSYAFQQSRVIDIVVREPSACRGDDTSRAVRHIAHRRVKSIARFARGPPHLIHR